MLRTVLFAVVPSIIVFLWADSCRSQVAKIELHDIEDRNYVGGIEMLLDDKSILTLINRGGKLSIWEWSCETGEGRLVLDTTLPDAQITPFPYRLSPDGKTLAYAKAGRGEWLFETVDIATGGVLTSVPFRDSSGFADNSRDFDSPKRFEFTVDLAKAYAIFNKPSPDQSPPHVEVRLYDTKTGSILTKFSPHEFDRERSRQGEPCSDICLSPDGRFVATVGGERKNVNVIKVFDSLTHTEQSRAEIKLPILEECITKRVLWASKDVLVTVSCGYHSEKQRHVFAVQSFELKNKGISETGGPWFAGLRFFFEDTDFDDANLRINPNGDLLSIDNGRDFQVFSIKSGKMLIDQKLWKAQGRHMGAPLFCKASSELWFVNEKAEIVRHQFTNPDAPRSIRK